MLQAPNGFQEWPHRALSRENQTYKVTKVTQLQLLPKREIDPTGVSVVIAVSVMTWTGGDESSQLSKGLPMTTSLH